MALRADGNANADFASAAGDGVGHEAVEADGGEEEGENGEETGEHGGDAVFDKLREGTYTLWVADVARARGVSITGAGVAELDWTGEPDAPREPDAFG